MLLEAWRSCGRRRKFIWSAPFKIPIDTRRRPLLKQLPAQRVYLASLDSQSQCQGQCQWQWQCQCQCYLSTHSPQAPMPLPLAVALPNPNVASYRSFLSSSSLPLSFSLSLCIFYSNYHSFAGIYVTVLTRTPGTVATTTAATTTVTTTTANKMEKEKKKDLKQFNTLHDIQILLWEITRVQPLSVVFRQL